MTEGSVVTHREMVHADTGEVYSRIRVQHFFGESMTKQSEAAATDINGIVARYANNGVLEHIAKNPPVFLDVSELGDYREMLDHVARSEKLFAGLRAEVRARFDNDVASFLDFLVTPGNEKELQELGLRSVPISEPMEQARTPDGQYASGEVPVKGGLGPT